MQNFTIKLSSIEWIFQQLNGKFHVSLLRLSSVLDKSIIFQVILFVPSFIGIINHKKRRTHYRNILIKTIIKYQVFLISIKNLIFQPCSKKYPSLHTQRTQCSFTFILMARNIMLSCLNAGNQCAINKYLSSCMGFLPLKETLYRKNYKYQTV